MIEHEVSGNHKDCLIKMQQLYNGLKRGRGLIDDEMRNNENKEREKWREILKRVVSCIQYLACQNLAFRRHREDISSSNQGNFLELVKLIAQFDPIMQQHLSAVNNSPSSLSYLSPTIQNELIHLMAKMTKEKLLEEIKEAKHFAILFDSTPDIQHRDQMSQVIRYVHVHPETKKVSIKELFLGFFKVTGKDAESLFIDISNRLEEDSLDIQDCRCQCYDNAAVMAGCVRGVSQRFLKVNPLAFFSNCDNHTLNLVGVHAVNEVVKMVTFFGIVDSLYKFFSRSTSRWEKLKTCIHLTLKYQSETRWSSRLEAIRPLSQGLEQIIQLPQEMSESPNENAETRSKSQLILMRMLTLDFLSLLPFWCHCLSLVDIVQKRLQDKRMNFHEAAGDIEALHMHFRDERTQIVSEYQ